MSEKKESSQIFRKLAVVIPLVMIAILIAGCSKSFVSEREEEVTMAPSPATSSHSPTNGMVQSSDGGAVTIDVEWMGLNGDQLVFEAALNTHSVDLDSYDLGELAVLRDDEGKEYHPTLWESVPGGHHRRGTLIFPPPDSLKQDNSEYLELIIRDVADIDERFFRWELR